MDEPLCEIVKEYQRLNLPTEDDLTYEARQQCIKKCIEQLAKDNKEADWCDCCWFAKNGGLGSSLAKNYEKLHGNCGIFT